MRSLTAFVLACATVLFPGSPAAAQDQAKIALSQSASGVQTLPASATFSDFGAYDNVMHARMLLSAPTYLAEIDRLARARGDLGTSDVRVFWKGPTRIIETDSGGFDAVTPIQAEPWMSAKVLGSSIRTKLSSSTAVLEMRFVPNWDAENATLSLRIAGFRVQSPFNDATFNSRIAVESVGSSYNEATQLPVNAAFLSSLSPRFVGAGFQPTPGGSGFAVSTRVELNARAVRAFARQNGLSQASEAEIWDAIARRVLSP
jgi:hypothetical protein